MSIGTRIKYLRKQNGLSQTELAEKIGVSLNTVSKIESNKSDIPSESLKKASEVFGVSADYLLTGKEGINGISEQEKEILSILRKDQAMTDIVMEATKLKKKALDHLGNLTANDSKDD